MHGQTRMGRLAGFLLLLSWGNLAAGGQQHAKPAPRAKAPETLPTPAAVALRTVATSELRTRAAAGDPRAAVALADRMLAGEGEPFDPKAALDILQRVAGQGDAEAKCELARGVFNLANLRVVTLTDEQTDGLLNALQDAAKAGWPDAIFEAGRLLMGEKPVLKQVPVDALKGWKFVCEADRKGSGPAATFIGEYKMNLDLETIKGEYRAAFFPDSPVEPYLLRGLERGDLRAYLVLGDYHARSAAHGGAGDPAKGVEWLEKGTRDGKPSAAIALARLYEEGEVVPKDLARARGWGAWAVAHQVREGQRWQDRRALLDKMASDQQSLAARRKDCEARRKALDDEAHELKQISDDLANRRRRLDAMETTLTASATLYNMNPDPSASLAQENQRYEQDYRNKAKEYNRILERFQDRAKDHEDAVARFNQECVDPS